MSTLFGGNLLTPAQRQESILRKTLELRRQFWASTPAGHRYHYRGAGDLLLQHGQFFSGRELPEEYAHLKGEPGMCFVNAYEATQSDPSLRYCEGVYSIGAGVYVPHAWCLDPDGQLLEVSLPTDPVSIANGTEARTHQPVLALEHWGYWGVVIHPEYMQACWVLDEGAGVLDRPSSEALEAANLGDDTARENYSEWREHWPIYSYSYDPERKVP